MAMSDTRELSKQDIMDRGQIRRLCDAFKQSFSVGTNSGQNGATSSRKEVDVTSGEQQRRAEDEHVDDDQEVNVNTAVDYIPGKGHFTLEQQPDNAEHGQAMGRLRDEEAWEELDTQEMRERVLLDEIRSLSEINDEACTDIGILEEEVSSPHGKIERQEARWREQLKHKSAQVGFWKAMVDSKTREFNEMHEETLHKLEVLNSKNWTLREAVDILGDKLARMSPTVPCPTFSAPEPGMSANSTQQALPDRAPYPDQFCDDSQLQMAPHQYMACHDLADHLLHNRNELSSLMRLFPPTLHANQAGDIQCPACLVLHQTLTEQGAAIQLPGWVQRCGVAEYKVLELEERVAQMETEVMGKGKEPEEAHAGTGPEATQEAETPYRGPWIVSMCVCSPYVDPVLEAKRVIECTLETQKVEVGLDGKLRRRMWCKKCLHFAMVEDPEERVRSRALSFEEERLLHYENEEVLQQQEQEDCGRNDDSMADMFVRPLDEVAENDEEMESY